MAVAPETGHVADGSFPGARTAGAGDARHLVDGPVAPMDATPRPPAASQTAGAVHSGFGTPVLAAPGLVLMATLAIFEGYHWLDLIPNGPVRPTAVLLALLVVPATFGLTRRISGPGTGLARTVARACAVLVPALCVVLLIVHNDVLAGVLGVGSLALALALGALAVLSEVGEHRHTGNH